MRVTTTPYSTTFSSSVFIQNKSSNTVIIYANTAPAETLAIYAREHLELVAGEYTLYTLSGESEVSSMKLASGGGSGINFDPNPPEEGINLFTGTSLADAKSKRDAYFTSNPDELKKYDNDSSLMIELVYPVSGDEQLELEVRINDAWINFLGQALGTVQLGTHSATELLDIDSTGSGKIITDGERAELGSLRTDLSTTQGSVSDVDKKVDDLSSSTDGGFSSLEKLIDDETTARELAVETLQGNIDAEELARQQADSFLTENKQDKLTAGEGIDAEQLANNVVAVTYSPPKNLGTVVHFWSSTAPPTEADITSALSSVQNPQNLSRTESVGDMQLLEKDYALSRSDTVAKYTYFAYEKDHYKSEDGTVINPTIVNTGAGDSLDWTLSEITVNGTVYNVLTSPEKNKAPYLSKCNLKTSAGLSSSRAIHIIESTNNATLDSLWHKLDVEGMPYDDPGFLFTESVPEDEHLKLKNRLVIDIENNKYREYNFDGTDYTESVWNPAIPELSEYQRLDAEEIDYKSIKQNGKQVANIDAIPDTSDFATKKYVFLPIATSFSQVILQDGTTMQAWKNNNPSFTPADFWNTLISGKVDGQQYWELHTGASAENGALPYGYNFFIFKKWQSGRSQAFVTHKNGTQSDGSDGLLPAQASVVDIIPPKWSMMADTAYVQKAIASSVSGGHGGSGIEFDYILPSVGSDGYYLFHIKSEDTDVAPFATDTLFERFNKASSNIHYLGISSTNIEKLIGNTGLKMELGLRFIGSALNLPKPGSVNDLPITAIWNYQGVAIPKDSDPNELSPSRYIRPDGSTTSQKSEAQKWDYYSWDFEQVESYLESDKAFPTGWKYVLRRGTVKDFIFTPNPLSDMWWTVVETKYSYSSYSYTSVTFSKGTFKLFASPQDAKFEEEQESKEGMLEYQLLNGNIYADILNVGE